MPSVRRKLYKVCLTTQPTGGLVKLMRIDTVTSPKHTDTSRKYDVPTAVIFFSAGLALGAMLTFVFSRWKKGLRPSLDPRVDARFCGKMVNASPSPTASYR